MKILFYSSSICLLLSIAGCASSRADIARSYSFTAGQPSFFSKIGLEMPIPDWNADVREHDNLLTIFAFPLVDVPVVSDQYGVSIQIRKLAAKDHRRYYPVCDGITNSYKWLNSQHLEASQNTDNPYWVYFRRDVFTTDGAAFFCHGQLKRSVRDFDELSREMFRLFESIHVTSNRNEALGVERPGSALTGPLPK